MIHPPVMRTEKLSVEAPAKINLFLEVLGKRPNGYHDVRIILAPISLCDILVLENTGGVIETTTRGVGVPARDVRCFADPGINLATRAAVLLKKATGYSGGARIHIDKNIPVGGGLGGGSTDAAATLRGLNRLWRTGLSVKELSELGRGLGSDVPAMVYAGAVIVEGAGERVTRINPDRGTAGREWWLAVVNPGFGVDTGDIYARYSSSLTSPRGAFKSMVSAVETGDMELAARNLFNSLEKTIFTKYPLLAMIAEKLRETCALGVLACGSGASLFGLAHSESHARDIVENLGRVIGPWLWSAIAKVLPDGVTVAHGPLEARV